MQVPTDTIMQGYIGGSVVLAGEGYANPRRLGVSVLDMSYNSRSHTGGPSLTDPQQVGPPKLQALQHLLSTCPSDQGSPGKKLCHQHTASRIIFEGFAVAIPILEGQGLPCL